MVFSKRKFVMIPEATALDRYFLVQQGNCLAEEVSEYLLNLRGKIGCSSTSWPFQSRNINVSKFLSSLRTLKLGTLKNIRINFEQIKPVWNARFILFKYARHNWNREKKLPARHNPKLKERNSPKMQFQLAKIIKRGTLK
jgi:hypothetical protein